MNNLVDIWKMNGKMNENKINEKNIYLYECKSTKLIKNSIKWKWINRCDRYEMNVWKFMKTKQQSIKWIHMIKPINFCTRPNSC